MKLLAACSLAFVLVGYTACVGEDQGSSSVVEREDAAPTTSAEAAAPSASPVNGDASKDAGSGSCWDQPFAAPVPVAALNTPDVELNVRLSADERTAYFTSNRAGGAGGADLWMAQRASIQDQWGTPASLGNGNSTTDDVHVAIAPNDLELFFARSIFPDGGSPHTDLFVVTRPSAFPQPSFNLLNAAEVPNVNTSASESMPYATSAGLYYARLDKIMYSARIGGTFASPIEISGIYEAGTVTNLPVMSQDGLRLFFASNRSTSKGALDIYLATRKSVTDPFDGPTNVAELNTPNNDRPGFISADGCRLYMTSDRPGGLGSLDIYVATRAP